MATYLQDGTSWLGGQLKTNAGRSVTITQGGTPLDAITAWCSKREYEVVDQEGFATSVVSHDWQFVASDLPAGFVFRAGDTITETLSNVVHTYEAMSLGSKPAVEQLDDSGLLLTVHTKQVR